MTDRELIEAVVAGNNSSFKELVKRYEPRIAATVKGMLGNVSEAEDVGQETFIRFYKGIKKFRGDASVGTYLTRIAINLSLNELKRRKRKSMIFQENNEESFELPDKDTKTGFDENKEFIHKAIQKLPAKFRSVIVLRLIDGCSTDETAKILKIPTGTVLSRLARAQQKLKEILSPLMGEII